MKPPFTWNGAVTGARAAGVLLPSITLYGMVFGVMSAAKGLSLLEAGLFSALTYAGGAQLASLQVWAQPIPLAAIAVTTLALNSRYLLLGATLRPWMGTLPVSQTLPTLFFMADGNWALAMREHEAGRHDAAFIVGSGIVLWTTWLLSTLIGQALGQLISDPRKFGVDFMLAAFFAALCVSFFRSRTDAVPLAVGAGVAIALDRLALGPWSIIGGALAGSLAGAWRHDAAA